MLHDLDDPRPPLATLYRDGLNRNRSFLGKRATVSLKDDADHMPYRPALITNDRLLSFPPASVKQDVGRCDLGRPSAIF